MTNHRSITICRLAAGMFGPKFKLTEVYGHTYYTAKRGLYEHSSPSWSPACGVARDRLEALAGILRAIARDESRVGTRCRQCVFQLRNRQPGLAPNFHRGIG